MPALTAETLAPEIYETVTTHAASEGELATCRSYSGAEVEWERLIRDRLLEWDRGVHADEDDDFVLPTRSIIRLAIELAWHLRSKGWEAPKRILMNGDGGIDFEHWTESTSTDIEIEEDGAVELLMYENSRLVDRYRLL